MLNGVYAGLYLVAVLSTDARLLKPSRSVTSVRIAAAIACGIAVANALALR